MTYRELDEICATIGLNNYTEDDEKCQKCGTLYTSETLDEYEGLCPECAKETVDIFRAFLNALSEPQRAYLNKFYDGEEIA